MVPPIDLAAPREEPDPLSTPAAFPGGSRAGVARLAPPPPGLRDAASDVETDVVLEIAEPGLVVEHRMFGGHELVVQHRGDEVTVILPGAVRLVGTRDEAIDLVRALLSKPADRRK
ncbi:MAG TPA: hypothetical protein VM734_20140 [Kofleriaceae bacterium]|nr:hypothetical protein [Kofleriaceae bacterium]